MLNFRNILTLKNSALIKWLLVSGLLVVVVWSWKNLTQVDSEMVVKKNDTPDFFFSKFKSTVMDASGQVHYELTSDMLYHYPDDDRAVLEFPVITLFQNSEQVWRVRANSGVMIDNGEQFVLKGGVSLFREADGLSLKTEELTVWPNQSRAETDQPVLLANSQGEIKAVGMQADLSKERLTLLSQVRGRYEPVGL